MIIPHFTNYPLLTKKYFHYVFFKEIVKLMSKKEHSNLQGIQNIVNNKASMYWGLSYELKKAFPYTVPVKKEDIVSNYNILVYAKEWMAGFSTGESNFFITVQKSKTKSGIASSLRFSIAQHSRDISLLESFVYFFGCGYVTKYKNRLVCELVVTKIDDIVNNIIPFFEKHKIIGSKYSNFLDFKCAALIINNKDHLKQDGIGMNKIFLLKKNITEMNKGKNNHGHD